ncbi:unnamed protein product [Chrysoparadoxa australica]
MGGGASLLPLPDERCLKCIQALGLKKKDLSSAFQLFSLWDKGKKGFVPLQTFYDIVNERKSLFGDSILEILGIRETHELEFGEWLQAMVTYCLFEEQEILR